MKYVKQAGIIASISFAAEMLHYFISLPVPASVYGLVLLFLLLCMKVIKLSQIEDVANWMLSIMPVFFIAPSVALVNSFESVKGQVISFVLVCFLSTIIVTAVTGVVSQGMIRLRHKKRVEKKDE